MVTKMPDESMNVTKQTQVTHLLEDAKCLISEGKLDHAYHVCLEATQLFPQDIATWYLRAETAPSLEEELMCLSRIYSLDPKFPDAKEKMHQALQSLLEREPYLAYLEEDERLYRVKSGLDLFINVPKNHANSISAKPGSANPTKPAYQWMHLAVFGIFLGGIGAVLLAPLAVFNAIKIQRLPLTRADRIRSVIVLVISSLLWIAALLLTGLFWLHFLP